MLKFAFGVLMLLIPGFLSSQVYTLKTDPDKDKYPEAFNTLNDLRSKEVYQNGTYIDITDEEIKSYLNIKGINQNYIEVINSYFDLVKQFEAKGYSGNKKFETLRDQLRKSRSKFSPYGSSKLIIYKGNSVPYKTLLTSDPYSWGYEKEKNLPLNNLENETLLNLLKLIISDNELYQSVRVTKEIKTRIGLGKFSDSEITVFDGLSKNEIETNFKNPPSNIDTKLFEKAVDVLLRIRYEDENTSNNYLKYNGFETNNFLNSINYLIEIVKISESKKLDEKFKEDSEFHGKLKEWYYSKFSSYNIKINGIQIEYKILFSKIGGREFGIDENTETLNDLDLEIGDLESLKVITEKDGQKELTKILDQLIEKKKTKTVISSLDNSYNNSNKNWVHSNLNQESDTKTIVYTNAVYWGSVKDNKEEGVGIIQFNNGDLYEGNFKNGLKNGFGTFYWSDGDRYEGNWVDDKKSGQGTFYFSNGDRFVGQFIDGKRTDNGAYSYGVDKKGCISGDCQNGMGKKVFTDGVYEGEFKNGKINGKGKYIYPNKSTYDGDWVDGVRQGKGKFVWYNGDFYIGDFQNDKRQGKGVYFWGKGNSEGAKYSGDWYEGERTGWGVYTSKNGTVQEGNFEKGVYKGIELQRTVVTESNPTTTGTTDLSEKETIEIYDKFMKDLKEGKYNEQLLTMSLNYLDTAKIDYSKSNQTKSSNSSDSYSGPYWECFRCHILSYEKEKFVGYVNVGISSGQCCTLIHNGSERTELHYWVEVKSSEPTLKCFNCGLKSYQEPLGNTGAGMGGCPDPCNSNLHRWIEIR